jgi:hypothetical protein
MGSATRGAGDRPPLQRNAFRQRLCLVLAEDHRRPHIKTSLVDYHLRQLRIVVDLDLRMKPRDPETSIRVALRDVQCPRCNGHGPTAHHRLGAASVDVRINTQL